MCSSLQQERQICWSRMLHWATWDPDNLTQQHFVSTLRIALKQQQGKYWPMEFNRLAAVICCKEKLPILTDQTHHIDKHIIWNFVSVLPVSVWGSPALFGHSVVDEISFVLFPWAAMQRKEVTLSKEKIIKMSLKHCKCKMQRWIDNSIMQWRKTV